MHLTTTLATVLTAALLLLQSTARADDSSDVQTAADAWITALREGDAAGVASHSVGTDAQQKPFRIMASWNAAARDLRLAVSKRFGDEGEKAFAKVTATPQMKGLEGATITVDGDRAMLKDSTGNLVRAVNDAGRWKIDLASIKDVEKVNMEPYTGMIAALAATADDIRAGRLKSVTEAKDSLAARIVAADQKAKKSTAVPDKTNQGK